MKLNVPNNDVDIIALCNTITNEIKKDYPLMQYTNIFYPYQQLTIVCDWCLNRKQFIEYIEKKYGVKYAYYESYPITYQDAIIFNINK